MHWLDIGRHNVMLMHMPGIGKANAAAVACKFSKRKLALVVGISGAIPFRPNGKEIILGDVTISNGVIQYNLGRQLFGGFPAQRLAARLFSEAKC